MEKTKEIKTPHINCNSTDIAKVVIMPGDPVRAKNFAFKYLKNITEANHVRGHIIYTGQYNGKKISVCPSFMGIGSSAIYFYELFNFCGVDTIIRMGTCGGLVDEMKIGNLIIANSFYTDTNFYQNFTGKENRDIIDAPYEIINKVIAIAKSEGVILAKGRSYSTDVFYTQKHKIWEQLEMLGKKCDVVEMEAFALQVIANHANKNAITLLSVSDNLCNQTFSSAAERQAGIGRIFDLTIRTAAVMAE